jgi:hypothetical protein
VSVQLHVLDDARESARPSGNWFVSREVLARYEGATAPGNFFDRMLWSLAEAIFSTEEGPPPSARLAWLCADMRDFLAKSGPQARTIFTVALFVASWILPFTIGRFPSLARLSVKERAEALERFESGSVAQSAAILALKATLCIVYFEHPDAARAIGFDGECKGITP